MSSWLNALGVLKWPSLMLILAPIMAYPFWLRPETAAIECGQMLIGQQGFRVFRSSDGHEYILRPMDPPAGHATGGPPTSTQLPQAGTFREGGYVLNGRYFRSKTSCAPQYKERAL